MYLLALINISFKNIIYILNIFNYFVYFCNKYYNAIKIYNYFSHNLKFFLVKDNLVKQYYL
jgi:hypothetical protein